MTATYAAALSRHPMPTHAVGEVVGELLDQLGGQDPSAVVCFVGAPFAGATEDIVNAVRDMLDPATLIAATAGAIIGGSQEIEDGPALSVWAACLPANPLEVKVGVERETLGWGFTGLDDLPDHGTLVVLVDPFSVPVAELLADLRRRRPGLAVIGGLASAAHGPGGNRIADRERVMDHGAVGLWFDPDSLVETVVSQGCRPIGDPLTVTAADGNLLVELAGRSALTRLEELLVGLDPAEQKLAAQGLHLGRVIDEHKAEFGRGDFLIRGVMGAVRDRGAVAVGDEVAIGDTVCFQVRDAAAADEDLRALLAGVTGHAALVFSCNGRGSQLFGRPHHDSQLISDAVGNGPTAGMFCAGELGPVGGRSFLHGFTASVAVFTDDLSQGRQP